ncbi:MAG: hypothetical protein KUG68_11480 [Flavobacteriaceae bacterium]|nr:hypothetical protein [Flavobacteriaceae bacterium]
MNKIYKYIILLIFITSIKGVAQNQINIEKEQWIEDIDFIIRKAEGTIPDFKSTKNYTEFLDRMDMLKEGIRTLSYEQIIFGIQYALNSISDEGCNIIPFQKKLDVNVLPIKTYWFDEGLFICDSAKEYSEYKGEEIIKINNVDLNEVYSKIGRFINTDNEYYRKYLFTVYGTMPSLLNAANLGESKQQVTLQFASGNETTITAESVSEYIKLNRQLPNDEYFSATQKSHQGENYWYEYLPDSNTLFVQIQKVVNNDSGDSFSTFVNSIETEITSKKANKLIIDLRYGGGGNGFKLKGFTDLLKDQTSINNEGNLFVLTSNATKGTLVELASILSLNTKAIIVGLPTGEGPNMVGDTKYIELPNSELSISLTHTFWPTSWASDKRTSITPDILVSYSHKQHQMKEDPWLDAVSNYQIQTSKKLIPNQIKNALIDTYKVSKRKVSIEEKQDKIYISMNRKMKSFFEFNSEIYYTSEGFLSTDIKDVYLEYNTSENGELTSLVMNWKGTILKLK